MDPVLQRYPHITNTHDNLLLSLRILHLALVEYDASSSTSDLIINIVKTSGKGFSTLLIMYLKINEGWI